MDARRRLTSAIPAAPPRPGPLRDPAFRGLWLAGLISDAGDWMLLVALPIVVYTRTGSTLGTAAAFMAELAPALLLAPLGGVLADRCDRRRLLVMIAGAQGVALLPLLAVGHRGGLALIYAVIVAQSGLGALFDPAKNALLPTLVGADRLVAATSLIGLGSAAGRLAGGPLGGLLLAAGDLHLIVAVDAVSFGVAAGLVLRMGPCTAGAVPTPVSPAPGPAPHDTYRSAGDPRRVRRALLVGGLDQVAQGIFVVLFVVFVARRLSGSAGEIGLLRGVQAVGAIGAGVVLATVGRRLEPGRLVAGASVVFGLISLTAWNLPAVTTNIIVFTALFIVVGAPGVVLEAGLLSVLGGSAPESRRGRVMGAAIAVEAGGQAIGMIVAGLLPGLIGLGAVLDLQGGLYVAVGALALTTLRPASAATRLQRPPPVGRDCAA